MSDVGAIGPAIALALLVVVMLWFTFGTQRNIRKGNEVLAWLQGGLPLLGRRTTLRWLGSSAVELTIVEPAEPVRDASVVIVLEPRDVGLLWAFARSRGRRDFMIVRLDLRRAPRFSADVGDQRGWTGRLDEPEATARRSIWSDGVIADLGPGADEQLLRDAWQRLDKVTGGMWRLTIQPVVHHLEVHARPPDLATVPADRVVGAVLDVARSIQAG